MIERYEALAPVLATSAGVPKGTVLEFNETAGAYQPLTTGDPAGVLMEDVAQSEDPVMAKVLFHGVVYADELQGTVTETLKAKLRKVSIFVETRITA